jgi:hypothetical protein
VRPPCTMLLRRGKTIAGGNRPLFFAAWHREGIARLTKSSLRVLFLAVGELDEEGRRAARQDCVCSIGSREHLQVHR